MLVRGYGFLSFAKNMGKILKKKISKSLSGQLLDHAKQSETDAIKTSEKEELKKQPKHLVICLVINLLIKSQKFQKIKNKIIPGQLKMSMIKKYAKKDIDLQKKDNKLLMN